MMDEKLESIVNKALYISLFLTMTILMLLNIHTIWSIFFLSCLLISFITLRNALIYPSERYRNSGKLIVFLDIAVIYTICLFDKSGLAFIYYLIIIFDISFNYTFKYSSLISLLCYFSYAAQVFLTGSNSNIYSPAFDLSLHLMLFVSVSALIYITRYAILQNTKLKTTMYELKIRSKQLEDSNIKLRNTSQELEEITILKERNRIAREIHDTVGHTLTTVLLEMEAGELLLSRNPELAVEKIHLAKDQVRKGLSDIRISVGVMKAGNDIIDFVPSLVALINDTIKHGNVFINHDISITSILSQTQEKAIYRALQEGLTNGIKHGRSTAFVFILQEHNGKIKFILQDNGSGFDSLTPGFGITSMEERVKEVSGTLGIKSSIDHGCTIEISFPIKREDML